MLHRVDPLALGRSVVELGSAAGLRPFFDRLHRGEAVSIGLLGASVGQSGGCLSQPYKRCMLYRGVQSSLDGYEPTRAGYLLQFFDAINRSWPHPQHAVFNAATDGNSRLICVGSLLAAVKPLIIRASSGRRM